MNSLAHTHARHAADAPAFILMTAVNREVLTRFVRLSRKADPFSRSAAYYAMTGRRGLWLYGNGDTAMLIARHPNREGRVLLFPPLGRAPTALIENALADPRLPQGMMELARIGPDDAWLAAGFAGRGAARREAVLDWAWPVHIVSPEKVIAREGKPFVSFRGHINRAIRDGLTGEPIELPRDRADIVSTVNAWADEKQNESFTHDDLTSPTLAVLDLMEEGQLDIHGTITRDRNGQPTGFWLWEKVDNIAISLARVALRRPGNAEVGILRTCEQAVAAGIAEVCTGGSESVQLDAFKRKMQPVRSIHLETLTLRSSPANDLKPAESIRPQARAAAP